MERRLEELSRENGRLRERIEQLETERQRLLEERMIPVTSLRRHGFASVAGPGS